MSKQPLLWTEELLYGVTVQQAFSKGQALVGDDSLVLRM
jgi:hypothetical protein